MSELNYNLTRSSDGNILYLVIPIEENNKGKKTITIDMDEYEMDETGIKDKMVNGKKIAVTYMKFKLIEKK